MPLLHLQACHEGGGHPAFPFPRGLFPSCQVLAPGRAVLYWNATGAYVMKLYVASLDASAADLPHIEHTEAVTALHPLSDNSSTAASTISTRSLLPPVPDASVTLGLLLKGEGVGQPSSWMALGVTPESKGMRGVDIGLLRWVSSWIDEVGSIMIGPLTDSSPPITPLASFHRASSSQTASRSSSMTASAGTTSPQR